MDRLAWRRIVDDLTPRLAAAGLDLAAPLRAGWYDDAVPAEHRLGVHPEALAVVVGATRALWPPFRAALAADAALRAAPHPLDAYTERAVRAAAPAEATDLRFAHEPPPRRVAMQAIAERAGLARRSPTFLSVHPVYGPWISLRAVVVCAGVDGPPDRPPPLADACTACDAACRPALARALAADPAGELAARADLWIAVRDACVVGRAHRYPEDMLRYGYTKDRRLLR